MKARKQVNKTSDVVTPLTCEQALAVAIDALLRAEKEEDIDKVVIDNTLSTLRINFEWLAMTKEHLDH